MSKCIRIATRESRLALWQAEHVRELLLARYLDLNVELVPMTTQGDQLLEVSLASLGGKGMFIKELEAAIYEGRADLAVHSMKDVPAVLPQGLALPVILERGDPYDAFVSNHYSTLDALPQGAVLGTASQRRQMQAAHQRPDLDIRLLRGNVDTRLRKLDEGQYDAIILASAGLKRLQLEARIRSTLPASECLPAIGQGAIGLECRSDDADTLALIQPLQHAPTRICLDAERALNAALGGSCQLPVAGFAQLQGDNLSLEGRVGMPDGSQLVVEQIQGPASQAQQLGSTLAQRLLDAGAEAIFQRLGLR